MPKTAATRLRQRAIRITDRLRARIAAIDGVCLFGSVARGDASARSDIDLLVFGSDPALTPSTILRTLPPAMRARVSISYCRTGAFESRFQRRPDFIGHIQQEGELLYDRHGRTARMLARARRSANVHEGLSACMRKLDLYRDPRPYRSNYLFGLAHLYAIGRGVVSLALMDRGTPEFNRKHAFDRFVATHPDLRRDIERVASLQPFYALVTGRTPVELPFSYRHGAPAMRRAVSAIENVARVLEHA